MSSYLFLVVGTFSFLFHHLAQQLSDLKFRGAEHFSGVMSGWTYCEKIQYRYLKRWKLVYTTLFRYSLVYTMDGCLPWYSLWFYSLWAPRTLMWPRCVFLSRQLGFILVEPKMWVEWRVKLEETRMWPGYGLRQSAKYSYTSKNRHS